MTWAFHPVWPIWAVVLAALALGAALATGCRELQAKHVARRWVVRLAVLRVLAVLLFLLALLRPRIRYERDVVEKPGLLVLADVSASMGPGPAGGESRLDQARRGLRDASFQAAWLDRHETAVYAFDRTARLVERGAAGLPPPDRPDTRLAESLEATWNLHLRAAASAGAPVSRRPRVLLITDGQDRGRGDAAETARRLGLVVDVADWPASTAAVTAGRLRLALVQTPARVLQGSLTRVRVTLRREGGSGAATARVLLEENETVLRTIEVPFADGLAERPLELAFTPVEPGLRRYTVRAEPDTGGWDGTGHAREFSLRVENERVEALVLEPTWRWEFKFLRRVFEQDPHFVFTGFLSRGPGVSMQFGEPERRVALGGYPQSRAELEAFDIFILGDVSPALWPQALPEVIRRLVVEDGKTLIVLAGPEIGRLAAHPDLGPLLPVELSAQSGVPITGPVAVRASLEGEAAPAFFGAGAGDWSGRWPDLPMLDRVYPPLRKKPAATVWLEATGHANAFGPIIVAAEHRAGRGRVLFVGSDTLWKWQMVPAPDADNRTPYSVFWQQALRTLQPARLAGAPVNIWLQPTRSRYAQGDAIRVEAELETTRPLERPSLEGTVTLPDGRTLPVQFAPVTGAPERYTAEFESAQPGAYQVAAQLMDGARLMAEAAAAWDVDAQPGEDPAEPPDRARLAALAAATGGHVLSWDRPETWPDPAPALPVRRTRTLDFWRGRLLLGLLAAVLGLDWLIRLMRGYVR